MVSSLGFLENGKSGLSSELFQFGKRKWKREKILSLLFLFFEIKGSGKFPVITQSGPFHHNECAWIASGSMPRDAGSAGLSSDLT